MGMGCGSGLEAPIAFSFTNVKMYPKNEDFRRHLGPETTPAMSLSPT